MCNHSEDYLAGFEAAKKAAIAIVESEAGPGEYLERDYTFSHKNILLERAQKIRVMRPEGSDN